MNEDILRVVTQVRIAPNGFLEQKTVEIHLKPYGLIAMNPKWELVATDSNVGKSDE